MKCRSLFSGKNKKIISKCHLLKFLPNMLLVKQQSVILFMLRFTIKVNSFSVMVCSCLDVLVRTTNALLLKPSRAPDHWLDIIPGFMKTTLAPSSSSNY